MIIMYCPGTASGHIRRTRPGRRARAHVRYMYVHICMYMYIYPPAPLGAIRLRSVLFKLPVPSPSNHLNHKLTVNLYTCMPVYLYTCIPVYLYTWIQSKWDWWSSLRWLPGPGTSVLPQTGCVTSAWVRPGYPLKIIKFQACPQDPQKSEKVPQRSPKVTKKAPKTTPGTPNY